MQIMQVLGQVQASHRAYIWPVLPTHLPNYFKQQIVYLYGLTWFGVTGCRYNDWFSSTSCYLISLLFC
jgi:hypothetical protein